MPAPGDYYAREDRKRWLQILESMFDLIYVDEPQATDAPEFHQHGEQA